MLQANKALELWVADGFEVQEITEQQVTVNLTIKYNARTGEVTWFKSPKLDGIQFLGILVTVMYDAFKRYVKNNDRPELASHDTQALIQLKDGNIKVAFDKHDSIIQRGLLAASLWHVVDQLSNPIGNFVKLFNMEINNESN